VNRHRASGLAGPRCDRRAVAVHLVEESDPATIETRLNERQARSRLERSGTPARELDLYKAAFRFLGRRGWRQVKIDCRGLDPEGVVTAMLNRLDLLIT
jgi:dTMP kinase